MPAMPAVSVQGLTKAFPTGAAIQDLSFAIQENEFVTLVGPSGCGKSTTLRMISGLMQPTAGSVSLRGQAVAGPIKDVGMVFQAPVLLPWRTTLSNVLFPADMRGMPTRDCRGRALELIRLAQVRGGACWQRGYSLLANRGQRPSRTEAPEDGLPIPASAAGRTAPISGLPLASPGGASPAPALPASSETTAGPVS